MTLREVALAIGADSPPGNAGDSAICRVATDSRQIRPGDIFWALPGEQFDGHAFVAQAFARGAAAAVVNRDADRCGPQRLSGPLLCVEHTRMALGRFAAYYRRRSAATVIGVTGSVGKTSAREAIFAVLSKRWPGIRSDKNFNNAIGVPLSLLELESHHRFAVIEMGASAAGEIASLAEIAEPHIGVLTAIGPAHLEGFGTIEGVARAKGELVAALGKTGVALLNADDRRVRAIGESAGCGVLWYGCLAESVHLFAQGCAISASGERVSFQLDNQRPVSLTSPGRHQVYAALAAVAVGRWMGMADRDIVAGLADYRPAAMRCQVQSLAGVTFINDAYNASPQSMAAGIGVLANWPTTGRRVLVCGDMKELGASGPDYHRWVGEEIARKGSIDLCLAVGPLSAEVVAAARLAGMHEEAVVHCETVEQASDWLAAAIRPGDVVLLKASRAMHLENLLDNWRGGCAA